MKSLKEIVRLNKQIRVIGFDDAPFNRKRGSPVNIAGIICSNTRFEGMIWGEIEKDGNDATKTISRMLKQSKFFDQVSVILTDGIAVGGFNIIDLKNLSITLERPCIAVMRKKPDMEAIDNALNHFSDYKERMDMILKAGEIYIHNSFYYQVTGCDNNTAAKVLERITDKGNVPEALRLAHMIGAAVINGQSSNRA
jgi:uncharacterized protein